jgi:isopenicillin N synthase-like dioxygenase
MISRAALCRFTAVMHFANNDSAEHDRYAIPVFLNANVDYKMACICAPGSAPLYPPASYLESEALVQGE